MCADDTVHESAQSQALHISPPGSAGLRRFLGQLNTTTTTNKQTLLLQVFCSSSIFNQNVMIAVATKKAENPVSSNTDCRIYAITVCVCVCQVAVVAQKLNMPEVAKSQPPLSIPGKLLVPR